MRLIDLKTNQVVEHPTDMAESFLRAGTHTISSSDSFFVWDKLSNETKRVTGEDLFSELRVGNKLLPDDMIDQAQEQDTYDDSNVRAATLSTLRGITGGLSDLALTKGMGIDPEVIRKLRKYNPIVDTAGVIGGTIAPFAAPFAVTKLAGKAAGQTAAQVAKFTAPSAFARAGNSAANAVAKALPAVGEGARSAIANKILQYGPRVVGGAVEGAFYGTSEFISEYALGEPEFNAEALFAQWAKKTAEGALLGGGLTLAGLTIVDAGKAMAKKLGGKIPSFTEFFSGVKHEVALKYLDDPAKYDKAMPKEEVARKINQLAKKTRERIDKGLVTIDNVNNKIDSLIIDAKSKQNYAAQSNYRALKSDVDGIAKEYFDRAVKANPPLQLVDEIDNAIISVKNRNTELDTLADSVLDGVDQSTTVIKDARFLPRLLKQIRRDFFEADPFRRGEFLLTGPAEKNAFARVNNLIAFTEEYAKRKNSLSLADMRNYLKRIRSEMDFGRSNRLKNKLSNLVEKKYQHKVSASLKRRAPEAYSQIMDEMSANFDLIDDLGDRFPNRDRINSFLAEAYRGTPVYTEMMEILARTDKALGTSITPSVEKFSKFRASVVSPTAELTQEIQATQSGGLFQEMLSDEALIEAGKKYPPAYGKTGQKVPSMGEVAKEEWTFLNRHVQGANVDLNKSLGKVADYMEGQAEMAKLAAKKTRTKAEVKRYDVLMKQLKNYESYDDALVNIERLSSQSESKIKAAFAEISSYSDDDFVELVTTLQVNHAFDVAYTRAYKNVNLMGLLVGMPLGALSGFGWLGATVGAVSGGMIDAWGPRISKNVLRRYGNIKGKPTIQAINNILKKEIPEFAEGMKKVEFEGLSQIEDATIQIGRDIESAPMSFLRKLSLPVMLDSSKEKDYELYKESAEETIRGGEETLLNFFEDNDLLESVAPATTREYYSTIERAIEFIKEKVPRGTDDYFDEYEPSANSKRNFVTYMQYLEDPAKIFKEIGNGFIPLHGSEVLQRVYPALYGRLAQSFIDALAKGDMRKIPMAKRVEIKTKIGIDLAPKINNTFYAMISGSAEQGVDQPARKIKSEIGTRLQTDMGRLQSKA